MAITVFICTHNRVDLLRKVLASLNEAKRPQQPVEVLVIANNCSDGTADFLTDYAEYPGTRLPLRWIAEPTPGKSHALNRGIPAVRTDLVAFVDDDHRIDADYLVEIERASAAHPEVDIFCGRILPDWTGAEPRWVHDEGPYRIYPLPVPRYDLGPESIPVTEDEGPVPGGGNLILRRPVFALAGRFSTELGPHGHDLGGGEDSEYVIRALRRGATLRYCPAIVQYHYVDLERLSLSYIVRKGFQRTRSTARLKHTGEGVPLFAWRKLCEYLLQIVFATSWQQRRFYLVRVGASLGEIRGMREASRRKRLPLGPEPGTRALGVATALCLAFALFALLSMPAVPWHAANPPVATAALAALALLAKSIFDFSQTGPGIQREHLRPYRLYVALALMRLATWSFVFFFVMAAVGCLLYHAAHVCLGSRPDTTGAVLASLAGITVLSSLQFVDLLLHNPGLLVASMHYRTSRLYPLWRLLSPLRVASLRLTVLLLAGALIGCAVHSLWQAGAVASACALAGIAAFTSCVIAWCTWQPAARPVRRAARDAAPNVLMIGSDTLRADRFDDARGLTPNIAKLRARGTLFTHCYVPCARTAPSLISLLTGTWPTTHGVRDNFVSDAESHLGLDGLPALLGAADYKSAAVSDWCGADMGKFDFGFDHLELPSDQWNLKYLIRQGPKDLRLFISLFVHNRLGRVLLPEIYYLGGVPLTSQLGLQTRWLIGEMAAQHAPFFINAFFSTTHPPFASEYPWYTRHTDPAYTGESKFAMARLTDPFDIIRRQAEPREEFDLEQILQLYDGCVAQFDYEVGRLMEHLEHSGLASNTIVVIYSDHGMEFFEHGAWGQGNSAMGDYSSRVPLLIADPRRSGGRCIGTTVRSIDIAPTLLELCGCAASATMDGVSLAPLLDGAAPASLVAYNETGIWLNEIPGMPADHLRYPGIVELLDIPNPISGTLAIKPVHRPAIIAAKDRFVARGAWKLVYQPLQDGYQLSLFDTAADPACTQDLAARRPDVRDELWRELQRFLARDGLVSDAAPLAAHA
ncbi:MAG TPA: sulfatase-like hydrolase/transferase [Gammaproteobacteria bacterium]|nr:sulfatase-like hydrolase/transferase [Gammaproteobacteria bacterium]